MTHLRLVTAAGETPVGHAAARPGPRPAAVRTEVPLVARRTESLAGQVGGLAGLFLGRWSRGPRTTTSAALGLDRVVPVKTPALSVVAPA